MLRVLNLSGISTRWSKRRCYPKQDISEIYFLFDIRKLFLLFVIIISGSDCSSSLVFAFCMNHILKCSTVAFKKNAQEQQWVRWINFA